MELKYIVNSNQYKTVKEVLKSHFHISERFLLKLKRNNRILLNNMPVFIDKKLTLHDTLLVDINFNEKSENIIPVKMDLNIIFEDEAFLIVNKPAGIPVHPSMAHFENNLSNAVSYYYEMKNIHTKIRPVNRLDKDTSGIVIFAKSEYIQECLIRQMKNHQFEKYYLAILTGNFSDSNSFGTIHEPIARKEGSIIEREINPNGQDSISHYKVIQNHEKLSLVEFQLETGRTHQIRVHSKHIGHPILGDTLYGTSSDLINRQALHSYKIKFVHPITNETMLFEIPIAKDMKNVLEH